MKQFLMLMICSLLSLMVYSQTDTTTLKKGATDTSKIIYTCSMHPEIQMDKPGNCPKCGMTLIVQTKGAAKQGMMMPGMMMGGGMMKHNNEGKKFPWKIISAVGMALMMGAMMINRSK